MDYIKIDGTALPPVSTYRVTLSDMDRQQSGRAENAVMVRERVRANVAKIELAWKNVTSQEMTGIINSVTPETFPVEYFFGSARSATMYAGDITIDLKAAADSGEAAWDVGTNLVEC